jgi:hypothetical protein
MIVFAERLEGFTRGFARRTDRQREAHELVAVAPGGEARLADRSRLSADL